MNNDEIIKIAREAGGATGWDTEQLRCDPELEETDFVFERHELVRFAALVAAAEREACALICESRQTPGTGSVAVLNGAANEIRARGLTNEK